MVPESFITLVIVVAIILVVLKLIKATAKLMITAVIISVIIWFVLQYTGGAYACFEPLSSAVSVISGTL